MNYTENYQLCQWEASDPIRREDFNADNAAIDAALGALAEGQVRIASGSYTGTGTYGADSPNTLTFDFEPKFLLIWSTNVYRCFGSRGNALSVFYGQYYTGLSASWAGNTVSWYTVGGTVDTQMNHDGYKYFYLAVG